MNEASRPVAVRVIRPYATEDEFLAEEFNTISKTTITLVGAHSRPEGVILRFEVTLNNGKSLVRGEGRVTSFTAKGRDGQPALTLRFTKLDPKSKALVDRAVAFRDGPAPKIPPAAPSSDPITPAPSTPSALRERDRDSADLLENATTPTAPKVAPAPSFAIDPSRAVTRTMSAVRPALPTIPAPSAYGERRKSDLPPPLPSSFREVEDATNRAPKAIAPLRPPTLSPPPLPVEVIAFEPPASPETEPAAAADSQSTPPSRAPTTPPPTGPNGADSTRAHEERALEVPAGPTTNREETRAVVASGALAPAEPMAPKSVKREALLSRLRSRAQALAPEDRARLLKSRTRGAVG